MNDLGPNPALTFHEPWEGWLGEPKHRRSMRAHGHDTCMSAQPARLPLAGERHVAGHLPTPGALNTCVNMGQADRPGEYHWLWSLVFPLLLFLLVKLIGCLLQVEKLRQRVRPGLVKALSQSCGAVQRSLTPSLSLAVAVVKLRHGDGKNTDPGRELSSPGSLMQSWGGHSNH